MNVLVFGAAGRTGRHVLDTALADGHAVTAFVRDPAKLHRADVRALRGDLGDHAAVVAAVREADAVVSAAGHVKGTPPDLMARFADALVEGLAGRGTRVVSLLGGGIVWPDDPPPSFGRRVMQGALALFAGPMIRDAQAHADRLRASDLAYVVARPPRLTDAPAVGRVTAAPFLDMGPSATLTRADLGRFLVDQIRDDRFVRAAPMVHGAG